MKQRDGQEWKKPHNISRRNLIIPYSDKMILECMLCSRELARRLSGTGVTTYCVHPGVIATDLRRHVEGFFGPLLFLRPLFDLLFMKTPAEGAQARRDVKMASDNKTVLF